MNQPNKGVALISGASSGIGKATAHLLAQQGYDLLLMARREARLEDLKNEIQRQLPHREVGIYAGDVRSKDSVNQLTRDHESALNRLSVIINNAGLAKGVEPFHESATEDWEEMLDTNVKGLLYLTRQLLPRLLGQKSGHIVNLGSVAGRWVYPGGTVYCATKFAIRAITEGLRQDLCGTGIRVTNIEPGMVETEFSVVRLGDQKKADAVYEGMSPLSAHDIAETIMWCLSRPSHVNIQEIVIYPTDQAAIRQVHRQPPSI